jgi:hypothetical protein
MALLTATDLGNTGKAPISILSTTYPGVYLRADCTNASQTGPTGTVNCISCGSNSIDVTAQFIPHAQADGSFCLESAHFPNYYLRMDGSGNVNCLYGIGDASEKFNVVAGPSGSYLFQSVASGLYLVLNGTGVVQGGGPGGTVNGQSMNPGVSTFNLYMIDQTFTFSVQHQQQSNWCWDAVSTSVALFYNANCGWTQGKLANSIYGNAAGVDCTVAANAAVAPCNQGCWPDGANGPLATVGHYIKTITSALQPAQLSSYLVSTAPVVCNISWAGGGGHIVALHGHLTIGGNDHVSVTDPWYGDSDQLYSTFQTSYQGSGTWDHSYPTK